MCIRDSCSVLQCVLCCPVVVCHSSGGGLRWSAVFRPTRARRKCRGEWWLYVRWCCCAAPASATARAGSPSPPEETRNSRYIRRSCVLAASARIRTVAGGRPCSTGPLYSIACRLIIITIIIHRYSTLSSLLLPSVLAAVSCCRSAVCVCLRTTTLKQVRF